MRASLAIIIVLAFYSIGFGQDMDNKKLNEIFTTLSDSITGGAGSWEMTVGEVYVLCITDEVNNRMRIIAPIADMKEVTDQQIGDAMEANFHSALDIRYAISENIMWAAFIHPLRELTELQVVDALHQVYSGALTFGSSYTSTHLSFPKSDKADKAIEKKY